MKFEYDPAKSESNQKKHGIGFNHPRDLWLDEQRLIVPARTELESRYALFAQYDGKIWTCIFTKRSNRIRIISVRRSRDDEKEKYHCH